MNEDKAHAKTAGGKEEIAARAKLPCFVVGKADLLGQPEVTRFTP
jgi:hypothetical protein